MNDKDEPMREPMFGAKAEVHREHPVAFCWKMFAAPSEAASAARFALPFAAGASRVAAQTKRRRAFRSMPMVEEAAGRRQVGRCLRAAGGDASAHAFTRRVARRRRRRARPVAAAAPRATLPKRGAAARRAAAFARSKIQEFLRARIAGDTRKPGAR